MLYARQIRHILFGVLACLALVGVSAAYWAIAGRDTLLLREDNPRRIEALARIQRGGIFDRNSQILAETVAADSSLIRRYPMPSTFSLVGYYSLRYGVGGAEAGYDELLSGLRPFESLADYFNSQILRLPQIGADIMLTIDTRIHDALADAMAGSDGAAIVMDAATGELLALVSLPSFDPNRLDDDWSQLIEAEGDPFFNRALQGNYQLGGNIYALWLAQAINAGFELSLRFTGAADPVLLDDGTAIHCVVQPASADLTLTEALGHGCPAPFKSYPRAQSAADYDDLISAYRFSDPVVLSGFPQPEEFPPPRTTSELEPAALALRNILGQGAQITTPLHLATIIAALANDGIAIAPWIHLGTRHPDSEEWRGNPPNAESHRMLSATSARRMRTLLRDTWAILYREESDPQSEIGGFVAMSRSGDETQLWLNGYATPLGENPAAFVILLEDSAELPKLLAIGDALVKALS
ncbi:MAG: penicillin-binding transpeptidase domain-containing protein [Chloroflexi bacterium]|nr:penicillin-binding transpeptidase domain-containing protein [Chloroflexota bacterium]